MTANTPPKPPKGVTKGAAKFFNDAYAQFRFRTAGELQMLAQAAWSLTRAEEFADILKREGLVINGSRGKISHPAFRAESQARNQFCHICRLLGISHPSAGSFVDD